MPKISIIVPVYKVEAFLHRCVDSILGQTLKDIEVILVDDGSPDNCGRICDEYSMQDDRVKVIHQQNKGLPGARNAGIKVATGSYLGFVDSDDFVEPDMFERLFSAASENNVDFVMCDYYRDTGNTLTPCSCELGSGRYDTERIRSAVYPQLIMQESVDYGPILSVWHCIYRTEFLHENKLLFDERVKLSEDCLFSACVCLHAESFFYLKDCYLYHYWYNPNSLSQSYKPFAWQSFCIMNDEIRSIFSHGDFDFSRQMQLHMLYFTLNILKQISNAGFSFSKQWKMTREVVNTLQVLNAMRHFRIPNVPFKLRVIVFLIKRRAALLLSTVLYK